jgi:50S ribosomal protein L16 3-hydroxylase
MLYKGKHVFINGESFAAGASDRKLLALLADTRMLDGESIKNASDDMREALHVWYTDGWLLPA